MIGWLSGVVRFVEETAVCIDVGGVGYRVLMPQSDLSRVGVEGNKATAFIHTHVREDALQLYGFSTKDGLELFLKLVDVQGVGPRTALAMLSAMEPQRLMAAIGEKDEALLTKIPGVGKKTAARIVLELGEKLAKMSLGGPAGRAAGPVDDLRSALANLGYRAPQIDRAVQKLKPQLEAGKPLAELVREALKAIG